MDERFRGKGLWIGLGALAIIFLCIMLCGMGAMFAGPRSQVYVQPPVGEEGVAPPPAYYGFGPLGTGRHSVAGPFAFVFGAIGFAFKLAFFGLLMVLLIGLVRRIWWGHHCWAPPRNWVPPEGEEGEGHFWSGRGPWAWHHYRRHGGPPPWWGSPAEAASEDEPGEEYGPEE